MSRTLKSALGAPDHGSTTSLEQLQVLSLEGLLTDGEVETSVNNTLNDINVLEGSLSTLESIKHKMHLEADAGNVSLESLESARVVSTHMFGEDVLFGDVSLESSDAMDELSLESVEKIVKRLTKFLNNKKSELIQHLSWLKLDIRVVLNVCLNS